jgi:hypothetical protein
MTQQDLDPATPWHAPDRAWTPLMWLIGAVAFALSAMVLAPLTPLLSGASGGSSAVVATEPNVALADAAKAFAAWSTSPSASAPSAERIARRGSAPATH